MLLNDNFNHTTPFFIEKIPSTDSWMVGNFHHRGFYRVNYDEQGWKNIQQKLNSNFSVSKRKNVSFVELYVQKILAMKKTITILSKYCFVYLLENL